MCGTLINLPVVPSTGYVTFYRCREHDYYVRTACYTGLTELGHNIVPWIFSPSGMSNTQKKRLDIVRNYATNAYHGTRDQLREAIEVIVLEQMERGNIDIMVDAQPVVGPDEQQSTDGEGS